jgi:radical SAM superfamily enzyme YgiQ (UPF0313 family)
MDGFRVALVRTFSQSDYKEPAEPLGIEALAAELRRHGIDCRLFDRELQSRDAIVAALEEYQPCLLGLSVMMEDNAADAVRLLLQTRRKLPALPCAVGGLFVTTSHARARALFPLDCNLIVGEGEIPLVRLCFELMGGLAAPATSARAAALATAPYPHEKQYLAPDEWAWMYRPHLQEYLAIGAPINMRSSRGCPGRCTFCATPSLPGDLGRWQGRTIANVADEMESLCARYQPHAFNFVDDDFGPLARVEALVEELQRRGLRCALSLQLRATAVYQAPDVSRRLRRLRDGGLCRVFIGLESFDRETLDYFDKRLDPAAALEAFGAVRDAGIALHIGYILWHQRSTVKSVHREAGLLKDAGFFTTKIVMSRLQLFPGCALQKQREEQRERSAWRFPLDAYFDTVAQLIAPLYDAWLIGALDVPRQYCLAYLEEGAKGAGAADATDVAQRADAAGAADATGATGAADGAAQKVRRIEGVLSRLDELAYAALLKPEDADPSLIKQVAAQAKEEFHAIGCTFDSPRRS